MFSINKISSKVVQFNAEVKPISSRQYSCSKFSAIKWEPNMQIIWLKRFFYTAFDYYFRGMLFISYM